MIQLKRVRTAITAKLSGSQLADKLFELLKAELAIQAATNEDDRKKAKKQEFKSTYWGFAKPQLKKESFGKCVYCESRNRPGAVEHFRPKGIYWWLAYCVDNYTYSCPACNSKKSNDFPISTQARLSAPLLNQIPQNATEEELRQIAVTFCPDPLDQAGVDTFHQLTSLEGGDIPNPYIDDPESLFTWEEEATERFVRVLPKNTSSTTIRRAEAAIKHLDLNHPDLLTDRWFRFNMIKGYKEILEDAHALGFQSIEEKAKDKLRQYMEPEEEFAAMARYWIKGEWQLDLSA